MTRGDHRDRLINVNRSQQGEGFYYQTNQPGLIPKPRRERLLEREIFATPSSLSTGPALLPLWHSLYAIVW